MSASRMRLPMLTREEVGYRNAIAQAPERIRVDLGEGEWLLQFSHGSAAGVPNGALRFEADWGGARFDVEVAHDAAQRFLRHVLPDAEAAELPETLRLAAMEALRGELEVALAGRGGSRRHLRMNAARKAEASAHARHRYAFTLTSAKSGEAIAGEISTDVAGLSYAAPMLKAAPRDAAPPDSNWIDALAIALRFEAGATSLDRADLARAETGDLILLDECCLGPDGEMVVAAGPGLGFRAKLDGQSITVTQPLGPLMAETTSTAGAASAGATERIPVRLTFDLGERSMTVAELRELKPGYTFDLGRDLRRAVSIRANGQAIGEGELVDIDGTLGVAITSMAPPAGK